MRINHNIQALNTYRQLSQNQATVSKHLEKLSSGLRINRASDDAAGLAISEKMRSQIKGLDMAERNTLDGVSVIQTAEGAIESIHSMLQRMRELSVQAANGTLESGDRDHIQSEIDQLIAEVDRVAQSTEFNKKTLLDGSLAIDLQIGANQGQILNIKINSMSASVIGVSGLSLTSEATASAAISTIDTAIETVSSERAKLGAFQNRLEHTTNNLGQTSDNLTAAESRIRDADMAMEMASFTKNNIINQAATAMLAQANQLPQGILQLLKG